MNNSSCAPFLLWQANKFERVLRRFAEVSGKRYAITSLTILASLRSASEQARNIIYNA